MNTPACFRSHLEGEGGISELWKIALPMVLSSSFETCVMFIDRLMLSKVSSVQMAAMLGGGLTCFTMMTFFMGMIGYSSAMIAHLFGANRKQECSKMVTQSFILSILSYPLILLLIPLGNASFALAGHGQLQLSMEREYFFISMVFTALFGICRVPLSSFFAGIGKTKIIMAGNLVGLIVNILVAYILIFGKLGLPALQIKGAALAVASGAFANFATLLLFYFKKENRISS
ncbi:MAG TPA: MATE family efflux transporter [Victivallales bacterium]|nr:MATE family efflux transporter [Victivallales bacterium]